MLEKLLDGYRQFRANYFEQNRELFKSLGRDGQSPKILLIGCSDSRVDPAVIFGIGPGDLFVLRNVANIIPHFTPDKAHHGTSAALEFAVCKLQVEHIIIMGHTNCGGVQALINDRGNSDTDFIAGWMSVARSARDRTLVRTMSGETPPDEVQKICEQEVVICSMSNLMSFPWIRDAASSGALQIHGMWFDVEAGQLHSLNPRSFVFEPIV